MKLLLVTACLLMPGVLFAQVRVMTYNIKFDDTRDSVNNWDSRKADVIGLLNYHEPDIIGVQEALKHQLDDMLGGLSQFKMIGVGRDDGKEQGEYSAILYNNAMFDVLDSGTFWLSPTPDQVSKGWDAALPRICTWALFEDEQGEQIYVFNTHFDHVGEEARLESARLIRNHILEKVQAPAVIMGDMNFTPDKAPYQVMTEYFADAAKDSKSRPYGPHGTFNAFRFDEPVTNRIDYIFLFGTWEVHKYATLSDSREMRYPSDHFPVLAELTPVHQ